MSSKVIDMTNLKVGNLTVIKSVGKKDRKQLWLCQCDCGNITEVKGTSLRSKHPTLSCGCKSKKYFVNLENQQFNNLYIRKHLGKDNSNNNIYDCDCNCGNNIIAQGSDIKTGKIKSCGCLKYDSSQQKVKSNPKLNIQKQLYRDYKYKALKIRNLTFSLSFDDFINLIEKECYYCGDIGVSFYNSTRKSTLDFIYRYNGIDRVNNDLGYEINNCVTCCKFCNQAKHTYTQEHFFNQVEKIYKNMNRVKE